MSLSAHAAAIVLAGGSGTRLGAARNKVYLPLAGRMVIVWSLVAMAQHPDVGPVVLVVREGDPHVDEALRAAVDAACPGVEIVTGGATRQESELAGLRKLASRIEGARIDEGGIDVVLIHDGARPMADAPLVDAVLTAARTHGGAVPGLRRDDVVAVTADGLGLAGPAPAGLVAVQTPQAFVADRLLAAYEEAARVGFAGTDTASCIARFAPDVHVRWVPGDERNFKITYAGDLERAEHVMADRP
ncbi:IspD/TarI family cytidylyltransferase [Pseudonocardia sp. TRM90224]|uniref:IspD/TarI family cytidylyltransferase n=1 Tax=Pseudonocardia sp. TRM90224 TaxID=2812678 RepID=UPI001E283F7C|nr:IspD/TarI family cytidylyltransferase [Pseudonocardia sp. TRM90224]